MKRYVDGYVLAVPKKNLAEYTKMASEAGKMWMKHGALEYFECVGDDLAPDVGGHKIATFPELTKLKPGEVVLFSFIVYKSRKHRDQVNAKVMADPNMDPEKHKDMVMPFEMERMAYAGFTSIVGYQK